MAVCEDGARSATAADVLSHRGAVALTLAATALFAVELGLPAFFDNEARYAEVAREMLVRGDWISPHLDFTLFLNKPPLTFWLAALVFRIAGPTEWARLVSVAAAGMALYATCRLGARLWGERAGVVAGIALATMLGFVLEARTLRPDMIVTASVAVALWCWREAVERRGANGWLVGLWVALGIGVLAKGMVPLVLAGAPIAVGTVHEAGWQGLRRLRPGLGIAVLGAIVVPWHVVVALRHPGFAWDYVVNQHLLFFFDRKLPRDSDGDSLAFFWAAFAGRAAPWMLLAPLTLSEAVRGAVGAGGARARGTLLVWLWIAGVLGFFSLTSARLEHYSLPALPAVALLAGRVWQRARAGGLPARAWAWLAGVGVLAAVAGAVGIVAGRALLARTYWILQAPGFLALAVPAAAALATAGVLLATVAVRRRADGLIAALALATVPLVVIVLRAEVEAEPLFSWRPLAHALVAAVPADAEIVFEAPEEYQLVGGLAYYTERRITLLAPPGFVPPTYLAGHMDDMFLGRETFARRWRAGERLAFVSDPQQRRETPDGLVPAPFHVIGRFGDRWVLAR
ncbi:MAG TPA: glycosyltransferase family 39 protein [Candidatus Binatia bacterium]|nr:glycosyltransferase family 39 protein [Candidatus Binatia bacterium]